MTYFYYDRIEVRYKFDKNSKHKGRWTMIGVRPDRAHENLTPPRSERWRGEWMRDEAFQYILKRSYPDERAYTRRARIVVWFTKQGKFFGVRGNKVDPE
jgi:hypothetical protein